MLYLFLLGYILQERPADKFLKGIFLQFGSIFGKRLSVVHPALEICKVGRPSQVCVLLHLWALVPGRGDLILVSREGHEVVS